MRRTGILQILLAGVVGAALLAEPAAAQYQIKWYSINSGGGIQTGGNFRLSSSIGQSVAGYTSGGNFKQWIGFWVGDSEDALVVNNINNAKLLDDGTLVSIAGKVATTADGDFQEFFYLEEPGRSSGIRVAAPAGTVGALARGSIVNVIGKIGTTPDGERQIEAPAVVIAGSTTPLEPLFMNNKTIGGSTVGVPPLGQHGVSGGIGTNNVGLLIRASGLVTAVNGTILTVDDGSGPVQVDASTLAAPPTVGQYITVIGISSLRQAGPDRNPLVLPRDDLDVAAP